MTHFIFDHNASELIQRYSSPLYVYHKDTIQKQFQRLKKAINSLKSHIFYACKANTNVHLLRILKEEGACVDVVSPWEAEIAYRSGFESHQLLYTGDNITQEEMRYCCERNIQINLGSLSQLRRYGELNLGKDVCVRVNPDFGAGHHSHTITGGPQSKFGVPVSQIDRVHDIVKEYGLRVVGVHAHVGSGVLDMKELLRAVDVIFDLAGGFLDLEFVDVGGGMGISYKPDDRVFDVEGFGDALCEKFREFCGRYSRDLNLYVEPGRFLLGQSGVLLVRAIDVKETSLYRFVGTDSGMNHLLRPALYGSYHHILNCSHREGDLKPYLVAGNICETGDVFTQGEKGFEPHLLPKVCEGDILAICDVGAYGFSMASNYNMRPRPAEVLVAEGQDPMLIRRRESFDDLYCLMRESV